MGKPTGFIEWNRVTPARRATVDRLRDSREFYLPISDEELSRQGGRCMDCGVPFCQQGCPLGNMIPDWNDLVYRGRWREAYERLTATNNLPELTGRLCPAPCEPACVLSINQPAVTIEQIEKEIIEHAFAEGWVIPRPPAQRTGKHVAIVGSGPAGLAAAQQLNSVGHRVTVYERDPELGGLCRFGIPDFKLEKSVLDRRIDVLRAEGIQFETGVDVGETVSWSALKSDHDALLIAIGAQSPRDINIPGRRLGGVHLALDYLGQQNRAVAGLPIEGERIDAKGKRVVILGGGDTGSDCLGTALRQGASDVLQLQLLEEPPRARTLDNPWPQWPIIVRTSSSQEEGGRIDYQVLTEEFEGQDGELRRLRVANAQIEQTPEGRLNITPDPNTRSTIDADMVILAIGFIGAESERAVSELGVEAARTGTLVVDDAYATSVEGVFSAGDAMRGASLIVWAIMDGREAARSIDRYLGSGTTRLPSRGRDHYFGGLTHHRQGSENR